MSVLNNFTLLIVCHVPVYIAFHKCSFCRRVCFSCIEFLIFGDR